MINFKNSDKNKLDVIEQKRSFLVVLNTTILILLLIALVLDFGYDLLIGPFDPTNFLTLFVTAIICLSLILAKKGFIISSSYIMTLTLTIVSCFAIFDFGSATFATTLITLMISLYLLPITMTIFLTFACFICIAIANGMGGLADFSTVDWFFELGVAITLFCYIYRQLQNLNKNVFRKNEELNIAYDKDTRKNKFGLNLSHKMSSVVTELTATASQQSSVSNEQVSSVDSAYNLYQQVEQNAIAINQLADSINTITTTILQAANRTFVATATVAEAVENGQKAVGKSLQESLLLRDKLTGLSFTFGFLSDLQSNLTDVSNSVKYLAKTIHTLGLSASLEAAGQGAAGQRFAKVATEVKTVAEKCAMASERLIEIQTSLAQNINSALPELTDSQQAAESVLQSATISRSVIDDLAKICKTSADEAENIREISQNQTELVKNIRASAKIQLETTSLVAKKLETVTIGATQTATSSQQLTQTALDLEIMSNDLIATLAA